MSSQGAANDHNGAHGVTRPTSKCILSHALNDAFADSRKEFRASSYALEIDEAFGDFDRDEFHADVVADVHALRAANDTTFGGCFEKANVGAFGGCAGDDAIEDLADAGIQHARGGDFA